MKGTTLTLASKVRSSREVSAVPVVCLGISAGGIRPLKTIFQALPPKTGLAFVVIHHLRSIPTRLPEILSASTEIPVELAADGARIRPDSISVLPSGMELELVDSCFALRPQTRLLGFSNVLTIFLQSLSRSAHPGVAFILSGADADGAAALKSFRRCGGITIAQDPRTAERSGMPISAIQTGAVDDVLPPEAIASKLDRLAHQFRDSAAPS
jgi:two-component system CheB/CheR fusion protein